MRAYIFSVFIFLIMGLAISASAWASGAVVPATCDNDFYDILKARAWMEGQREMELAHKLIEKSDSVLEYSCFDSFLDTANSATGEMFQGISGDNDALAGEALTEHLQNFGGSAATNCSLMDQVWENSKCKNIDKNDFVSFRDIVSNDLSGCNASSRATDWNSALAVIRPSPNAPPASGGVEAVTTYFDILDMSSCLSTNAIKTGLMIRLSDGTMREDASCVAPSCSYDGTGGCQ